MGCCRRDCCWIEFLASKRHTHSLRAMTLELAVYTVEVRSASFTLFSHPTQTLVEVIPKLPYPTFFPLCCDLIFHTWLYRPSQYMEGRAHAPLVFLFFFTADTGLSSANTIVTVVLYSMPLLKCNLAKLWVQFGVLYHVPHGRFLYTRTLLNLIIN